MPYHVLIADNQRGVSRLLRSALETIEQDLNVSEAQSGEEAILDARRAKTDLLVTDYRLPGISGLELMRKFRVVNPECKVIMISDKVDPELRKMVSDARPEAFFQKPVPLGDFLRAVERCLGLTPTILPSAEVGRQPTATEQAPAGLSSLLANLRKRIGAEAVLLLNNDGEVKAEAGQIAQDVRREGLISALVDLRGAAQKAASLIGHSESFAHIFKGESTDFILVQAGPSHALLLFGPGLAEIRALSSRLRLIAATRADVVETLKNMGIEEQGAPAPTQKPAMQEPITRPEELPGDFLKIFNQPGGKTTDANSFWDSAVEQGTPYSEPDKLTYEQASRLGLTPDSAQQK